jgi:Cu(I)/Ag(I) efflux system periplasmic protein CusF
MNKLLPALVAALCAHGAWATSHLSDGEIRKIDRDAGKITIKHGEIRNLDMPSMTMVFQLKDPSLIDRLKPGDKVKFAAEQTPGGIVITEIEMAK